MSCLPTLFGWRRVRNLAPGPYLPMSTPARFTRVTLLGRLALGPDDQESWQEFFDRYGPHVLRWCRKFGCPAGYEHDILQDVMIKVVKAFSTFRYDPTKRFQSWLKTVTRSAMNEMFRSPQFRIRASGDPDAWEKIQSEQARDDLEATIERAFDLELWDLASREVREEVEEKTWRAFQLTEIEGQSVESVAANLSMSVASVYASRSRMKKRLEAVLTRIRDQLDGDE